MRQYRLSGKKRLFLLAVCLIGCLVSGVYTLNLKTYHWHKWDAILNGYILGFFGKLKEAYITEPDGYDTDLIQQLADQYASDIDGTADDTSEPHIIVIMNEAFSDLGVIGGELSTNEPVAPFISSLTENTISGYALASIYGGSTSNSEYEFLTGNSLAWLPPNVVPYQQYVRSETYSMVSYLKAYGKYECIAMHPYLSSGWNRPGTYENMGFDQWLFQEDFPQKDYVRQYISDQEMVEKLIDVYEKEKENPLFLFSVSMQNHGGYIYEGENYEQSIWLEGYEREYPTVEQYLSLIHETDKAVEYLIRYFESVEDEVVIVFFGDHQPKLDEAFYEELNGGELDTLDERQEMYQVPFFVWANYDIEERYVECTSLNYLSTYVYEAAGIPFPAYNQFLIELEEVVPAINANGYYSATQGGFLTFDQAEGEEAEWLCRYEILQYNSLFDRENRSDELFPCN